MIVHASVEGPDSRWGGIGTAVDLAARATLAMGDETLVLTPGPHDATARGASGYLLATVGVEYSRPEDLYRARDRVTAGQELALRMHARLRAELCDTVTLVVHSEELVGLLERASNEAWCRQRIAFTHGLAVDEHPQRDDLAQQQHAFFLAADRICTASEAQTHRAALRYPDVPFSTAPLPLALLVAEMAGLRQCRDSRQVRFVAAGRAVPQKGFDILLDAVAGIESKSSWQLHLAVGHGDDSYLTALRDQVQAMDAPVTLGVWRERADLLQVLAGATVAIIPSRFEPLGLIAAEAIALGTSVIASDVGGLSDVLCGVDGCALVDVGRAGPRAEDLTVILMEAVRRPPPRPAPVALSRWTAERFVERLLGVNPRS